MVILLNSYIKNCTFGFRIAIILIIIWNTLFFKPSMISLSYFKRPLPPTGVRVLSNLYVLGSTKQYRFSRSRRPTEERRRSLLTCISKNGPRIGPEEGSRTLNVTRLEYTLVIIFIRLINKHKLIFLRFYLLSIEQTVSFS